MTSSGPISPVSHYRAALTYCVVFYGVDNARLSRSFAPRETMASVSQTQTIVAEAEEPIRAELFSVERLEQHAESLAAAQTVTTDSDSGRPLIPRVAENGRALLEYYRATAKAAQQDLTITPAAEWLVDNFYIVEEQLREIRDDLPPGFYKKLPKL